MKVNLITHQELWEKGCFGQRNLLYKYLREKDCPSMKIRGKWFVEYDEFCRWHRNKMKKEAEERNRRRKY